jgi:hypothetical protein
MRRLPCVLLLAGWTAAQLFAQLNVSGLDHLASRAKESVDITLDSNTLKMASSFLSSGKTKEHPDSEDTQKVLEGLKGIVVRSFEFDKEGQYRMEDLEPIRAQLRAPGWVRIVNVQSKEEISEIYTRVEQGKTAGFAIIAAEPKELTVIAIEGNMNLSDLSKLKGLGVPSIGIPGSKDEKKKGKQ